MKTQRTDPDHPRSRTPSRRVAPTGLVLLAGVVAACAALAGCRALGYRLGATLPPGIQTIHVPTFVNQTDEPQLEAVTTRLAIQEFQREGNLRVVTAEEADAVLEVSLIQVAQEPLRYARDSAKAAEEYRLIITARITLKRADTEEEVIPARKVAGKATFDYVGDMNASKRVAIPDAARDLAHNIVESIVEYW